MRISDWSSDVCSSDLSLYTFIRRDTSGALYLVPYHEEFAAEVQRAAALLEKAAVLAEDKGIRDYLELRAKALRTDRYRESELAWLEMKDKKIGRVIGHRETRAEERRVGKEGDGKGRARGGQKQEKKKKKK